MERTLDADAVQRLAKLRDKAASERRRLISELSAAGPDDALSAIAWTVAVEGAIPEDPTRLVDLIDQARASRLTWREIAEASGEGSSQADARRVRERYRLWTKD